MTSASPRAALRHVACAIGAAALAAVGFSAPAQAQDLPYTLGSSPAETGLFPHPASGAAQAADFEVWLDNPSEERRSDARVVYTIDFTGVQGVADWKYGEDGSLGDCEAQGAVVTCSDWGVWEGRSTVAAFQLSAAAGSADGDSGTVKVSGTVDGASLADYTAKVSVGGPDLVAAPLPSPGKSKPGDVYNAPLMFANAGTQAADGVLLTMRATHGVEFVDRYDNCEYSESSGTYSGPGTVVICAFDDPVGPGEVWEADPPERLRLAEHALYDEFSFRVDPNTATARSKQRGGLTFTRGEGRTLTLKQARVARTAADLDPWNNLSEMAFDITNHADFAAWGATAKGAAGDTVKVSLGWQNKGPAWVGYTRSGEDVATYEFLVPEGAKVTKKPAGCRGTKSDGGYLEDNQQLGAPRYVCSTGAVVLEKEKFSYPFELKIEKVVAGASGRLTVGSFAPTTPQPHPFDDNHKNNTASLVLNGTGGGSGSGGSGGDSGDGGSDGGSASGGDQAQSTGGTGGDLASTGAGNMPLVGGLAAAVLVVGGTLFVVARRRGKGEDAAAA
ncbi:hypothetical protein SRB5_34290 [Streptomyces sp. RB5]|uniref:Peptidase n=1 Tax=Streptomyces smaragdinus TaxID=2585196 RepID=A0A7K0CIH5_9ACTN|nr:peptidase [Streptomyces smaragdinus]MQY13285.1 hypothetical protein [Streptomyces smaragdinus]